MSQHERSTLSYRKYRGECESEIYHVTTRGISKQTIFEDDYDRNYLLWLIKESLSSAETNLELYAWCFMSNHVHLLAHAHLQEISRFMARILSRYARHFNNKHGRTGHLFEKRFSSSPIDTTEYLFTAVRYVHHNPKSAGCTNLQTYQWSSFREYTNAPFICNTSPVLDMFGGIESFLAFHQSPNNDQQAYAHHFESADNAGRASDDNAITLAKQLLGLENLSSIGELNRTERNRILAILKTRLTIGQISRITGIGRNIVQRAK